MNFFKALCGLFGTKGQRVYRAVIDDGKAVAPVAGPLVQAALSKAGLPATAEAALTVLANKAVSTVGMPPDTAAALQAYVAAHLPVTH